MKCKSFVDRAYEYGSVLLLLSFLILLAGCGDGAGLIRVRGKVTYQGQPVTKGRITFYPSAGGRPAGANIGGDGEYQLTYSKDKRGTSPGKYDVTVESKQVTGGTPSQTLEQELSGAPAGPSTPLKITWLVPEKYARKGQSELVVTVESGVNTYDIDIP